MISGSAFLSAVHKRTLDGLKCPNIFMENIMQSKHYFICENLVTKTPLGLLKYPPLIHSTKYIKKCSREMVFAYRCATSNITSPWKSLSRGEPNGFACSNIIRVKFHPYTKTSFSRTFSWNGLGLGSISCFFIATIVALGRAGGVKRQAAADTAIRPRWFHRLPSLSTMETITTENSKQRQNTCTAWYLKAAYYWILVHSSISYYIILLQLLLLQYTYDTGIIYHIYIYMYIMVEGIYIYFH